jgi:lactoylglutathione lyase
VAFEDEVSAAFEFENMLVNLLQTRAAHDLIAPAPVAVPDAGSRFQLTIWVGDVDAASADLARRGVALLIGPVDRAWGQRTASFAGPDGHVWEIAQALPETGTG